jgi:5-methylcytosine-specific restriction endonuclease McrA
MRKDTKARDFDRKAKLAIMERDKIDGWPCCIYCGAAAPSDESPVWSNAHFIARSQGGLGVQENGLTLCPACHRRYDQTTARPGMREFFRKYLKSRYALWSEKSLIYRKGI